MTMTLTEIRESARRAKARRERVRRLRAELDSYQTPAERAELDAILARHQTTLTDVLRTAA
jgi:molecular chaperone GrpE (heat shock protein)